MTTAAQELPGRVVCSRDGYKLGEIREVVYDGGYVLIRRSLFSKLVAPVRALEQDGDRLTVQRNSMYLDRAPKVDPKHELSEKDRARIDQFFLLKDAYSPSGAAPRQPSQRLEPTRACFR